MTLLFANIFTITGALIFFVFGIVYFHKSRSVMNHCQTTQKNLEELNEHNRVLVFALMRGAGGGAIAIAVIIIWLQLQYATKFELWIPLSILVASALFFLPSVNAMFLVKRNTSVRPPVLLLTLAMVLTIAGYFLNIRVQ